MVFSSMKLSKTKKTKKSKKTKHLEYRTTAEKIIFGDDDLSIKLSNRERDNEVTLDICIDDENGIVIGTGGRAQKYAAQIIIPARRYDMIDNGENEDGEPQSVPMPLPFDMSLCTLELWGLED